jgi:uncharacterized membrane protein
MKRFLQFFLQGLILFIPLIITLMVLLKLFDYFVELFSTIGFVRDPFVNTLLGLVVTVGFIALLGLLASSFVFREMYSYFEDKLEHAPFIRHIYSPVKDFTNAFVGNKRRFRKPVLVLMDPVAEIRQIGFITNEDLEDLGARGMVAVYLPLSFSLSGKLVIVPASRVQPIQSEPAEVMKFVVSGGVTDVDHEHAKGPDEEGAVAAAERDPQQSS